MVICDEPTELVEVISETSAIVPSRRSSGAATVEAMVEGLPPAMLAWTTITGYVTLGSGATGRWK